MIEKILEAYEVEFTQKSSFFKIINKKNKWIKFILGVNIVVMIVILLLVILKKVYIYPVAIGYYGVAHLQIIFFEKSRHKKWRNNIIEYNKELDKIAEILKRKEFNLYEKIKIQQLIRKFQQSINDENQKRTVKNSKIENFVTLYIVPLITFFAGKINNTVFSSEAEWIAFGLVVIIMLLCI